MISLVRILVPFLWPPCCPCCKAPLEEDRLCSACLDLMPRLLPEERQIALEGGSALDGLWALAPYQEPLRGLLLELKFHLHRHAAQGLKSVLLRETLDGSCLGHPDGVVPLPLSRKRWRERGFNQAALLAEPLARSLGLPLQKGLLGRKGGALDQVGLTRRQRLHNLHGVFRARRCEGRALLLVDDVVTTGATLEAAARTCKQAGARRVWALCLCRTLLSEERRGRGSGLLQRSFKSDSEVPGSAAT